MGMTFEDWFYEVENYGLRAERALDDVRCDPTDIDRWLRAAYEVGFKAGGDEAWEEGYEAGKESCSQFRLGY